MCVAPHFVCVLVSRRDPETTSCKLMVHHSDVFIHSSWSLFVRSVNCVNSSLLQLWLVVLHRFIVVVCLTKRGASKSLWVVHFHTALEREFTTNHRYRAVFRSASGGAGGRWWRGGSRSSR